MKQKKSDWQKKFVTKPIPFSGFSTISYTLYHFLAMKMTPLYTLEWIVYKRNKKQLNIRHICPNLEADFSETVTSTDFCKEMFLQGI